jgi:hypothetical protein
MGLFDCRSASCLCSIVTGVKSKSQPRFPLNFCKAAKKTNETPVRPINCLNILERQRLPQKQGNKILEEMHMNFLATPFFGLSINRDFRSFGCRFRSSLEPKSRLLNFAPLLLSSSFDGEPPILFVC